MGTAAAAAAASGRGADGLPVPSVLHELELPDGAGLGAGEGLATTEVQPRPELPTGVVTLGGGGREDWATGARRSASLPRLGPDGVRVDERRGNGMRVSILRMS